MSADAWSHTHRRTTVFRQLLIIAPIYHTDVLTFSSTQTHILHECDVCVCRTPTEYVIVCCLAHFQSHLFRTIPPPPPFLFRSPYFFPFSFDSFRILAWWSRRWIFCALNHCMNYYDRSTRNKKKQLNLSEMWRKEAERSEKKYTRRQNKWDN